MKVWIDFDNAPHVPLLVPVARELERLGYDVFATARDFTQTVSLLDTSGINYQLLGRGFGKSRASKILSLFLRLVILLLRVRGREISFALSHGSRTQTVCAWLKRIPCVVMTDYEYTESWIFRTFATRILAPGAIPLAVLTERGFDQEKIRQYNGLKEHLYLPDFSPDRDFRGRSGIPEDRILVTIRPPGTTSNYHDRRSEELCLALIEYLLRFEQTFLIILPKHRHERNMLVDYLRMNTREERWNIPDMPLPGLQLLWHSDLVVSGGGTMNREGALLGVPTYSIFTGRRGAVDRYLESVGKLRFVGSIEEIQSIPVRKRDISWKWNPVGTDVRDEVLSFLKAFGGEMTR